MFGIVLAVALSVIISVLVCRGVAVVAKSAVALSKVVFSLFVAFVIHSQNALVENAWLNYGIWAAICLAVCFLLCQMPRFHFAFQFFCTAVVSYVVVGMLVKSVVSSLVKAEVPPVLLELAVKAACAVVTVDATVKQMKQAKKLSLLANPVEVNFERLMASLLYALALYILFAVSAFGAWTVPSGWDLAIMIGLAVLAFVADCLLMEKVHGKLKVIHQQEQAAAAAAPRVSGPSDLSYDSSLYDPDDREPTFSEWLAQDLMETEEFLMDTDYLDDPDYND